MTRTTRATDDRTREATAVADPTPAAAIAVRDLVVRVARPMSGAAGPVTGPHRVAPPGAEVPIPVERATVRVLAETGSGVHSGMTAVAGTTVSGVPSVVEKMTGAVVVSEVSGAGATRTGRSVSIATVGVATTVAATGAVPAATRVDAMTGRVVVARGPRAATTGAAPD